jgi:hypothetical protein
MVLNRKTDRRRRLLVDSNSTAGELSPAVASGSRRASNEQTDLSDDRRPYAISAQRRHQRKITDLIPKRRMAYSLAIGCFVCLLIALNLLSMFAGRWESVIGREGVEALSMAGSGTLTNWLATIFLAATAGLCLQIYALRQHRSDDYEGTYRIWGWLFAAFAVASVTCYIPLGRISINVLESVTGRAFVAGSWVPAAIAATLASLLLIRFLLEVRFSYGTVVWAVLAWLAVGLGLAADQIASSSHLIGVDPEVARSFAIGNGLIVAAGATLWANLTYGRFVFLRSNGFIKSAPKKIKKKKVKAVKPRRVKAKPANAQPDATVATATSKKKTPAAAKKTRVKAKPAVVRPAAKRKAAAKPKVITKPTPAVESQPADAEPVDHSPPTLKFASSVQSSEAQAAEPVSNDSSDKLRQLAAASRAKQASGPAATGGTGEESGTIKLSKAERKRLRKQNRQKKRAA